MKVFFLAAGLFLSSSAYSFVFDGDAAHSLSGQGVWKSQAGQSGTYSVQMEVKKLAKGKAKITQSYQLKDGKSFQVSFKLVRTSKNFFDVYKKGAKVGEGYCFAMPQHRSKACHWECTEEGKKAEGTIHAELSKGELHRMGSFVHEGTKYIWVDGLKKAESSADTENLDN